MDQKGRETVKTSLSTTSTDGDKMKSRSNFNLVTSGLSVGNLLSQGLPTNHSRVNSAPIVSIGRTRPASEGRLPFKCRCCPPEFTMNGGCGTENIGSTYNIGLSYLKLSHHTQNCR